MNTIHEFIAIDLETTGLDFDKERIIEIACAHFKEGAVVNTWEKKLNPQIEVRPFIQHLTGLQNDELCEAPLFDEIANELIDFIQDLPLVAHNAQFDIHFIQKELNQAQKPPLPNPVYDSLLISRIAWFQAPNHKLESLISFLNLETTEHHRALPDAIHSGQIFILAQNVIQNFSTQTLNHLAFVAQNSVWQNLWPHHDLPLNMNLELDAYRKELSKLSQNSTLSAQTENLEEIFSPDGPFSGPDSNFTYRQDQLKMSQEIFNQLNNNTHLAIEAETGIGKSLAYLSASFLYCSQNPHGRILISTGTRILQDQILEKEIPKISKLFPKVKFALLKGRENYICLQKYHWNLKHCHSSLNAEERLHFLTLIPWISQTHTGEISENTGFNSHRNRILWQKLHSTTQSCQNQTKSCSNELPCFYNFHKKNTENAQICVVNHALTLKNIQLDFALLPRFEHLIVDEAHQWIHMTRQHLGKEIYFYKLRNLLQSLEDPYHKEVGLLHSIPAAALENHNASEQCETLLSECRSYEKELYRFFANIGKNGKKQKISPSQIKYKQSLLVEMNLSFDGLQNQFLSLNQAFQRFQIWLEEQSLSDHFLFSNALNYTLNRLKDFHQELQFIIQGQTKHWTFWVEEWQNPHKLKICAMPLQTSALLDEKLFPLIQSSVFCSATLSIKNNLDFFIGSISRKEKIKTLCFESPFDLKQNRSIGLVDYLVKPTDGRFNQEVNQLLVDVLLNHNKSTLILFTSHAALQSAYTFLNEKIKHRPIFAQNVDGQIQNLLELFRKKEGSILLGNQIFWDGIDLPGKQLELLILTKLPFPNPSEPITQALAEEVEKQGKNPFTEIYVPEAILDLKQGLGRLIRSESDSGQVLILDPRIVTQPYGKSFTRIWNQEHAILKSQENILEFLKIH